MRSLVRIVAASSLCLAATSTAAPRAPAGKWVIEFAEHQCLATRHYGTGDDLRVLAIKPSPTGKLMQIIMVVNERVSVVAREAPVTIQIDQLPPIKTRLLSFGGKEKGTRLININLPVESFAPMRRATSLSIASKGINESLALKQMPALMAKMDSCLLQIQNVWNIGEAAQARLQSTASADLASYFTDKDYPGIAIMNGRSGIVEFVMLINEEGRVADCMVTETSGVPVLDAQTCAVARARARFTPAVGADGKPAKDSKTSRVSWLMTTG